MPTQTPPRQKALHPRRIIRGLYRGWQATAGEMDRDDSFAFWRAFLRPLGQWSPDLQIAGPPPSTALDPMTGYSQEEPWRVGLYYEYWQQADKSKGVYYTPKVLADYLVNQTLGPLLSDACTRIETAMAAQDVSAACQAIETVKALTILDPACGCGIFLSSAMAALLAWYEGMAEQVVGWPSLQKALPQNPGRHVVSCQLYGMDVDPLAVAISEWILFQQAVCTYGEPFSLVRYQFNLSVGNALALPESEQSLESRFPHCADGWDLVLTNPPYTLEVRENAGLFEELKNRSRIQGFYHAKMDLAEGFVYLAVESLKLEGRLGAVLPAYWLSRSHARPLREYLMAHTRLVEVGQFNEESWFERAPGHHTSLLVAQKQQILGLPSRFALQLTRCDPTQKGRIYAEGGEGCYDGDAGRLTIGSSALMSVLNEWAALPTPLILPQHIQQGVVLPQGRIEVPHDWGERRDQGLFLLTPAEIADLQLSERELAQLKPYFRPAQFQAWLGFEASKAEVHLLYGDQAFIREPEAFGCLKAHLARWAEFNTSSHRPYGLHRARQQHWFEGGPRIYGLRQTPRPAFAKVSRTAYVNEGFNIMALPEGAPEASVDLVLCILNSRLFEFWSYHQKRKGQQLQVDKDVLKAFPAPACWQDPAWRCEAEALAQKVVGSHNADAEARLAMESCLLAAYGLTLAQANRLLPEA